MSFTVSVRTSVSGEVSLSGSIDVTGVTVDKASPASVLAAQPATLTTRTNNVSGSLTMTNGSHGVITGQRLDLYWDGGACYGAVAGTVAGSVVPIASVSGGAVLPAAASPITVGIPASAPIDLTGNNVIGLWAGGQGASRMYMVFADGGGDLATAAKLVGSGEIYAWKTVDGSNPLSGDVPTKVWLSHDSTGGPKTGLTVLAMR